MALQAETLHVCSTSDMRAAVQLCEYEPSFSSQVAKGRAAQLGASYRGFITRKVMDAGECMLV